MVMQRLGKAVEAQVSGKALRSGKSAPRIQPRIVSEGEGAATALASAVARCGAAVAESLKAPLMTQTTVMAPTRTRRSALRAGVRVGVVPSGRWIMEVTMRQSAHHRAT